MCILPGAKSDLGVLAIDDRRKGENHTVSVVDDGVHWAIPGRNSIKSIVFHFHTPKLLEFRKVPKRYCDTRRHKTEYFHEPQRTLNSWKCSG